MNDATTIPATRTSSAVASLASTTLAAALLLGSAIAPVLAASPDRDARVGAAPPARAEARSRGEVGPPRRAATARPAREGSRARSLGAGLAAGAAAGALAATYPRVRDARPRRGYGDPDYAGPSVLYPSDDPERYDGTSGASAHDPDAVASPYATPGRQAFGYDPRLDGPSAYGAPGDSPDAARPYGGPLDVGTVPLGGALRSATVAAEILGGGSEVAADGGLTPLGYLRYPSYDYEGPYGGYGGRYGYANAYGFGF